MMSFVSSHYFPWHIIIVFCDINLMVTKSPTYLSSSHVVLALFPDTVEERIIKKTHESVNKLLIFCLGDLFFESSEIFILLSGHAWFHL